MDNKFYIYDYSACPYCKGDLIDAGKSSYGNQILCCQNCGAIFLEKDIEIIKKERKQYEDKNDKVE